MTMNRSVEPALISLVPSLNASLPPQLIELAGSLLAQSRHRASTLKGEEELARPYACAHLACERLKTLLDLPPITPRPPIPPRIYKRLYTHIDKILPSNVPGPRTPSKQIGIPTRLASTIKTSRSLGPARDILGRTPSKSTGRAVPLVAAPSGLPPWVHPTIRYMCSNQWGNQLLAPSILAGIETIAAPGGRPSSDPWIMDNLTCLLAAIALLVRTRQSVIAHGGELEEVEVDLARREIMKGMARARVDVKIPSMDDEEAWQGHELLTKRSIEAAVSRTLEKKWHEADWYLALDEIHERSQAQDQQMAGMEDGEGDEDLKAQKSDSMFQDQWNFLTDRKREEHRVWKARMLRRIDDLEKSGAMVVD